MGRISVPANWREEKRSLEGSELWHRTFINNPECGIVPGENHPRKHMPLSELLEYLDIMLLTPDLKAALDQRYDWFTVQRENNYLLDPDDDPRHPGEAAVMLLDFRSWYLMKSGLCPNDAAMISWVHRFYYDLRDHGITDIYSPEARKHMRNIRHLDFDR